jgi:hypothetical protein
MAAQLDNSTADKLDQATVIALPVCSMFLNHAIEIRSFHLSPWNSLNSPGFISKI